MPNDFYTPTGNPPDNSAIVSTDMRAEFAAINAGFNKLPALTGNANKLVVINSSGTGMDATVAPAGLTSINKIALTQPANGATFTLLDGKTLTVNNTLTLAGTDGTTMTFPATSASVARIDAAQTFVGTQTFSGLIAANLGLTVAGANFTSRGITDSATAKALTLSGSGANSVTIANSATNPTIGTSAGDLAISSRTVITKSSAAEWPLALTNTSATGVSGFGYYDNSSVWKGWIGYDNTTSKFRISDQGANGISIDTNNAEQVRIVGTASANRFITLTGSNGGNPTIGTSAGALNITSALGVGTSVPAGLQLSSLAAGNGTVAARFSNLNAAPVVDLLQTAVDVAAGTSYYHYRAYQLLSSAPASVFSIRGDGAISGASLSLVDGNAVAWGDGSVYIAASATSEVFSVIANTAEQVRIVGTASANRYITLTGSNGGNPTIGVSGGNLQIGTSGSAPTLVIAAQNAIDDGGEIQLLGAAAFGNVTIDNWQAHVRVFTGGGLQLQINNTAGANRNITLTGSNGGNPTIGTSAGDLTIAPATAVLNVTGNVLATGNFNAGSLVHAVNATATPAGGAANTAYFLGAAAMGIYFGSGAPTVSAAKGSIYLRSDGSATNNRMYVNTDGATTWTAVTTAA